MTGVTGERPPSSRDDRRTNWTKTIVCALIASAIFVLFLQPILTVVSGVTVRIVGVFYEGYIDSLYDQATMKPADQLIFLMFSMLIFGLFAGTVVSMTTTFSKLRDLERRVADTQGSTVRKTKAEIQTSLTIIRRRLTRVSCGVLVQFLAMVITISGIYTSINVATAFERRLMALSSVISEPERNGLLREWAMMKSKAEYEAMKTRMIALANKYNTTLPDL